ncbi:hypothetical protein BKA62DRAFT_766168 [Auriculariales sp. MPI-PUGE-AT-0066]|nr:hypothetical protein BKA62DRAFT_766168 [Auriculariales sp. MPI-PUGE-AT-0066]
MLKSLLALASLAATVTGHARVTNPPPRLPGSVAEVACGPAPYKQLAKDLANPIEGALAKISETPEYNATGCPLFKCRGLSLKDNMSLVQTYTAGDIVSFHVSIVAHHTGYANVSIIDLETNTEMERLYTWKVYANSTIPVSEWPLDEKDFNVTIPALGGKCASVGACAIQWFWYATENSQTYMNCVDFTSET